jgi:hypothetical protein
VPGLVEFVVLVGRVSEFDHDLACPGRLHDRKQSLNALLKATARTRSRSRSRYIYCTHTRFVTARLASTHVRALYSREPTRFVTYIYARSLAKLPDCYARIFE